MTVCLLAQHALGPTARYTPHDLQHPGNMCTGSMHTLSLDVPWDLAHHIIHSHTLVRCPLAQHNVVQDQEVGSLGVMHAV